MRASHALTCNKTRARCRVQKFPRVSCYKILPLVSLPSQKGPGGALCGVLASRNIVCRLCTGTRHRGRKSGRCGACVPPGCFACAMQPPTTKTSQPGGRLTRAGSGLSRNLYARVGVGIFAAYRNDPGGANLAARRGVLSRCSFVV